jgi:hypothetical protein
MLQHFAVYRIICEIRDDMKVVPESEKAFGSGDNEWRTRSMGADVGEQEKSTGLGRRDLK